MELAWIRERLSLIFEIDINMSDDGFGVLDSSPALAMEAVYCDGLKLFGSMTQDSSNAHLEGLAIARFL